MSPLVTKDRDEWIAMFAKQLSGSFNFSEAHKCWDAGFNYKQKAVDDMVKGLKLLARYHGGDGTVTRDDVVWALGSVIMYDGLTKVESEK